MSEMSPEEQDYALHAANVCLVPGGVLVIADETTPEGGISRLAYQLRRLLVAAATYLLTQTTTRLIHGLCQRVQAAGFSIVSTQRMWSGGFLVLHAIKAHP